MNQLQQEIANLIAGKHKHWHLQAMKISSYGDFGREYDHDRYWAFVVGFDYKEDAERALAEVEKNVADGLQYGGDDYEFRLVEKKKKGS